MQPDPVSKYPPFPQVPLPNRQWPGRTLTRAPIWCSVDLRDGNQALAQPMSVDEKIEFFEMLVRIGFKEIEVGFPSASQIEFDFTRRLIEEDRIPGDVAIQVLCQCRDELITRSLESVRGAKNVIFHLYNSTSPKQREYVFNLPKEEIVQIAVRAVAQLKRESRALVESGTRMRLEYSPESFTSTELEFALVSLHTHNDRGTGIAATELALLAGADRVEGTLFGNGERTGNLDIVTLALNLYTHGVAPGLDFGDLNAIRDVYERCTRLEVPPRQPYAGELVFTAFSGSHQDAIKKSLAHQKAGKPWDVLYIPIDPSDIGRSYRAIIRINSQSGKGGVAYVLEQEFGFQLPKLMHKEIGRIVNDIADEKGTELTSADIRNAFHREYLNRRAPVALEHFKTTERDSTVKCEARIVVDNTPHTLTGEGNGPIDAFVRALRAIELPKFDVVSYAEHSLGAGAEARAVSYIQIKMERGSAYFGAGIDTNIELASIKAIVSALNRAIRPRDEV